MPHFFSIKKTLILAWPLSSLKMFIFLAYCFDSIPVFLNQLENRPTPKTHLHTQPHTIPLLVSLLSNLITVTLGNSTLAFIPFMWIGLCVFLSKLLGTMTICCSAGTVSSVVEGQVHLWCWSRTYNKEFDLGWCLVRKMWSKVSWQAQ